MAKANPGGYPSEISKSICWELGRAQFEKYVRAKEKFSEVEQTDRLNKFFKKNYTLEQARSSCKEIQTMAAGKYGSEDRQSKLGNLLETMNTFKDAVDGILSSAPESVSAVWCGIGMIIKIVSDDLVTCNLIVQAFDNIITIILFSLILERRYFGASFQDEGAKSDDPSRQLQEEIFQKVQDLACAILDFSWHTQYHLSPQWHRDTPVPTPHAQSLADKVKSGVAKTGQKLSNTARVLKETVKEAIIGDIKSKHQAIVDLYEKIRNESSILFQEASQDTLDRLDVMLRETKERIDLGMQEVQESVEKSKEEILDAIQHNAQQSKEAIIKTITEAVHAPQDILARYQEWFQPSPALGNFLHGLKNRKAADKANTENSWILENTTYQEWRDGAQGSRKVLCLSARKGHGKTMTMLSVYEELNSHYADNLIILHFFFKLGDTELQSGVRAFENFILQLTEMAKKRGCDIIQLNDILGSATTKTSEEYKPASSSTKCGIIRDLIQKLSIHFQLQVLIIIDAIDECQDRSDIGLLEHLRELTSSANSNIQVLISVREEIEIQKELSKSAITEFTMLNVDPEDTSHEMKLFLTNKLKEIILTRVRDPTDTVQVASEMAKYLPKLQDKVKGDFAYANMVVANLREPSQMSLGARIHNLPSNVEEMYRQSLEGMKSNERLLIIFALRWIAWSFSDISALEIAEHYRGVYRRPDEEDEETDDVYKFYDPSLDPEVRETIHHLRTIGRDFFTFMDENEAITVHLSVKEWIRKPVNIVKDLPNTHMNAKLLNSIGGNIVFEVQIPATIIPSGHHETSELFSAEDSLLGIATDIRKFAVDKSYNSRPTFQQLVLN
ncbi:hypothetical protein TWF281_011341 [Arthrobotrys megalospora]